MWKINKQIQKLTTRQTPLYITVRYRVRYHAYKKGLKKSRNPRLFENLTGRSTAGSDVRV